MKIGIVNANTAGCRFIVVMCSIWVLQQMTSLVSVLPVEAKMVRDQVGRECGSAGQAQRVVALAPSITEIIFSLGRQRLPERSNAVQQFPRRVRAAFLAWAPMCIRTWKRLWRCGRICASPSKTAIPRNWWPSWKQLQIPVYAVNPMDLARCHEYHCGNRRFIGCTTEGGTTGRGNARPGSIGSSCALPELKSDPECFFRLDSLPWYPWAAAPLPTSSLPPRAVTISPKVLCPILVSPGSRSSCCSRK